MKAIVIEGEKFSGKSTLAREVQNVLTTATLIESRGYFFTAACEATSGLTKYLKALASLCELAGGQCIVVRAHFSPFALFKDVSIGQFRSWDHLFQQDQVGVVLLTNSYSTYLERLEERRSMGQSNLGGLVNEFEFNDRQQRYREATTYSRLNLMTLSTDNASVADEVDQIFQWMKRIGAAQS